MHKSVYIKEGQTHYWITGEGKNCIVLLHGATAYFSPLLITLPNC
jgi:hypothetical protein